MAREEPHSTVEAPADLGDEARLADPRLARDRDNCALSREHLVESPAQRCQLLAAPDERSLLPRRRLAAGTRDAKWGDSLRPPLQLDLAERFQLEQLLDLARRACPDHELPERLQACRHVDRVPERVVEDMGRRVALRDNHRSGVDRHTCSELDPVCRRDLGCVATERLVDREPRRHGTARIVLVGAGNAEEREDAVPRQLRESAAEAFDLLDHQLHHLVEQELRPLGAELLRDRGRAADIGEENRDHAPLAGCHGRYGGRPGGANVE
jgi:hypothetical protein